MKGLVSTKKLVFFQVNFFSYTIFRKIISTRVQKLVKLFAAELNYYFCHMYHCSQPRNL